MNKQKWSSNEIPLPVLALKLVEEVGEVAKEITDAYFITENPDGDWALDMHFNAALSEIKHVLFLAEQVKRRIEADKRRLNKSFGI